MDTPVEGEKKYYQREIVELTFCWKKQGERTRQGCDVRNVSTN